MSNQKKQDAIKQDTAATDTPLQPVNTGGDNKTAGNGNPFYSLFGTPRFKPSKGTEYVNNDGSKTRTIANMAIPVMVGGESIGILAGTIAGRTSKDGRKSIAAAIQSKRGAGPAFQPTTTASEKYLAEWLGGAANEYKKWRTLAGADAVASGPAEVDAGDMDF